MSDHRGRRTGRGARSGQSVVEYMLGISVIAIGMALGFNLIADMTKYNFDNVRRTVQLPYP